ncbi:hypothetical protein CB0940_03618 [Cercospora beticola]|uniref:Alpha/beta hydrolase fold-3 domain-containing protein n=1 Tax=Cercospora beticola TaxID=122368 RepID=A0A2G5I2E4_CERBT|nr:hypothetical protein CB0940_03618 [Cercospora beticola]PIA98975.1 hypothetical protein CB0940_03618 [Cercospora beticola]WPB00798.1 hypothetical protein RHO25_005418 [Cercospora beticola]
MTNEKVLAMREAVLRAEQEQIATLPTYDTELEEFDTTVELPLNGSDEKGGDGLPLKIIRRKNNEDDNNNNNNNNTTSSQRKENPRPLILLFHGACYLAGTPNMLLRPGREFALELDAVVLLATVRKAPEFRFPIPFQDGAYVAQWAVEKSCSFGADVENGGGFVIGGYSAGAQIAAVVAGKRRELGLENVVTGCFLGIPLVLGEEIVPEGLKGVWDEAELMGEEEAQMKVVLDEMLGYLGADVRSEWFSPFNCEDGLKGFPAVYMQAGGKDILCRDAVVFEAALKEVDGPVKLDVYSQMGHAGYTIWAQGNGEHNPPGLKEGTIDGMRWLLERGKGA